MLDRLPLGYAANAKVLSIRIPETEERPLELILHHVVTCPVANHPVLLLDSLGKTADSTCFFEL